MVKTYQAKEGIRTQSIIRRAEVQGISRKGILKLFVDKIIKRDYVKMHKHKCTSKIHTSFNTAHIYTC
jgi:hypothetical protein